MSHRTPFKTGTTICSRPFATNTPPICKPHNTLNYIHYNPVKHKWAESSVHWYLEHHGREWLRDVWRTYPVRDYGQGWDDL